MRYPLKHSQPELNTLNRREFLAASAVLACAAVSRPAQAIAIPDIVEGELTILSDGHLSLPRSMQFPDAVSNSIGKDELDTALANAGQSSENLTPDCNITLWKTQDRVILFDVGSGPYFMPTAGKLLESLEAENIEPEEVTDVVLTHAHPDHLWGLIDDFDELICANANYHISSTEWDFWRADDAIDKVSESRRSFVVGAQNRFAAIEDEINLFSFGQEILPGVESVDTSGHTPGHTSFVLHSASGSVLLVGDALTHQILSFEHPEWPTGADQDQEKGIQTRLKLLDRLAQDKLALIGFHLSHPGVGYVEKTDTGFQYVSA